MADAVEKVKAWASTVTAPLVVALLIGGLNLHGDVRLQGQRIDALTVLAQATELGKQGLESNAAGVKSELEGLRRDIDKVGKAVEDQARESAKDRSDILQAIGRLEGQNNSPDRR